MRALAADPGLDVRGTVRARSPRDPVTQTLIAVGDLSRDTDWRPALTGADAVVHTAGRVHVMDASDGDPIANYRTTNVDSTLQLARQAIAASVRRLLFLSSIKVNGESTPLNRPFRVGDSPKPNGAYAVSKAEAEAGLRQIGKETGLEIVIIRPVLVYGPGVRANFLSMMRWIERGVPFPFGLVHNARSLVALDNLVDLIRVCLRHPAAAGETFLVSDGEDLSTPDLIRRTGDAMGRRTRLMPVPVSILRSVAKIVGKPEVGERLCGSLRVDIEGTKSLLGWTPPISVDHALAKTVRCFLNGNAYGR